VSYPAAYPGALAVSAVGPQGRLAPYSSYGPEVAIAAPGGDKSQGEEAGVLQETLADGSTTQAAYRWFQGTSMATPHVAGAAALLMSLGVSAPGAVERLLTSTAKDPAEGRGDKYGAGLLDAAAAVRKATLFWGLWRLAIALGLAWLALRHARVIGQLRASEKPGALFWLGLCGGAGALAMLAPLGAERIPALSFLALPPAAWPQRFVTPLAGYIGWSALVPFALALPARVARAPLQNAFGALAAGLAFGWTGTLLHAAIFRTVALPYLPALLTPFWLLASAMVAWMAGRGLLARGSLR
jgi:serine protease